jgi:hypothetical protein
MDGAAIEAALEAGWAGLDVPALAAEFRDQGGFLTCPDFLPASVLEALQGALPGLAPRVNRSRVPGVRQGGSVGKHTLAAQAPAFTAVYDSPALRALLHGITGEDDLLSCPDRDPHAYALYHYTQAGDWIDWHYDTSYYRGKRYTVLFGLVDRSACKLEVKLHTRHDGDDVPVQAIDLEPGRFVVFDGDAVLHRVSPAEDGDERVALTLEYLTDTSMNPFWRLISDWKDAVVYFGVKGVFGKR